MSPFKFAAPLSNTFKLNSARTAIMDLNNAHRLSSNQQKIMLARSRFKNTKDLWLYLTERRKYLTRSKIFHFHVLPNSNRTRIRLESDSPNYC